VSTIEFKRSEKGLRDQPAVFGEEILATDDSYRWLAVRAADVSSATRWIEVDGKQLVHQLGSTPNATSCGSASHSCPRQHFL